MAVGLPLDLRDFLLRARVLRLYRQALRTIRRAPVDSRAGPCAAYCFFNLSGNYVGCAAKLTRVGMLCFPSILNPELRDIIRQELETNRNCNDKQKIRFLISDGLQRLKGLDETLDMQGRG